MSRDEPPIDALLSTLGLDDTQVVAESSLRPAIPAASPLDPARLPALAVASVIEPTAVGPTEVVPAPGGPEDSDFVLKQRLGEGGMGVVYLAHQASLARDVAVKSIKPSPTRKESGLGLMQEALITGALEHPNVIPIYALGRDPAGQPLLVMKRVEGVSWRELIRQEAHPYWPRLGVEHRNIDAAGDRLEWHLRVLIQVANAVDFAHQRGYLHRDLKPDNVMVGAFGEVYVLDWGLGVKLADTASQSGSAAAPPAAGRAQVIGTPAYMAPEMTRGELAALDARTDIYLLGAILHEIITGKPPHGGTLRQALISAFRALPPTFEAQVPDELAAIARQALAAAPGERHPTAKDFRLALERYLRRRGALALCQEALERSAELERRLQLGQQGGPTAAVALYRIFAECRFGFRQALRTAGDSLVAQEGLERVIIRMTEYELAEGHPEAAAALLAELVDPPAELGARVTQLLGDKEQQARELETLRRGEREMDLGVGNGARAGAAVAVAITFLGLVAAQRAGGYFPTLEQSVLRVMGFVTALLVIGLVARRRLFANLASSRLALAVFGGASAVLVQRIIALKTRPELPILFVHDLVLLAGCCLTAAIVFDRRFIPVTLWLLLQAVVMAFWPARYQLLMAIAVAGAMGVVAVSWLWPRRTRTGAQR